ncbi:hypothetical protein [Saccharothrix syringae]|uniref:hypothetical protein n=1 Tax=Saccharothrix syringae TaxID=103733 RepID=UPI001D1771AB|nr:hypothetical protein [Saccharothrix syringae]
MADWSLVVPRREVERVAAERAFGRPDPRLAGHVLDYAAQDQPPTGPVAWRVAPLAAVTVVLDLAAPDRRSPTGRVLPASPVLGLRDRPLEVVQEGACRDVTVALTPAGAHALFGVPLRELANEVTALADLLGREAALLLERLAEAPGRPARFRVLDAWLGPRLDAGPEQAGPVRWAWRRVMASGGRVRVDRLAAEVGWTRQHLTSRFREQVGLTPKAAARVARLHRAVSLPTRPVPGGRGEVRLRGPAAPQPRVPRADRVHPRRAVGVMASGAEPALGGRLQRHGQPVEPVDADDQRRRVGRLLLGERRVRPRPQLGGHAVLAHPGDRVGQPHGHPLGPGEEGGLPPRRDGEQPPTSSPAPTASVECTSTQNAHPSSGGMPRAPPRGTPSPCRGDEATGAGVTAGQETRPRRCDTTARTSTISAAPPVSPATSMAQPK